MFRQVLSLVLFVALTTQIAFADPITYQQVSQGGGLAYTRVPTGNTAVVTTLPRTTDSTKSERETRPARTDFVRLPDGRITKSGPGLVCDENCVEGVSLTRAKVSRTWYVLAPVLAAGVLCAVLCRGNGGTAASGPTNPTTQATIILQASPSPTIATGTPTPTPPSQVPEPGTLALLGLGVSALLAKRKLSASDTDDAS